MSDDLVYRRATVDDALCLSVLAAQVFLDTYALHGVNQDVAKEVTTVLSLDAFIARLRQRQAELFVAEHGGGLVGLMDLDFASDCPVASVAGLEILRLYVQQPFQRRQVGRSFIGLAEQRALATGKQAVWLTAWVGNTAARAFYQALGYDDVGVTAYLIEGQAYENRVLAKALARP